MPVTSAPYKAGEDDILNAPAALAVIQERSAKLDTQRLNRIVLEIYQGHGIVLCLRHLLPQTFASRLCFSVSNAAIRRF